MKNREKYREEIIKSHGTCEFINDTGIPELIGSTTDSKCICDMGDCRACLIRFTLWLDEEYEESEVDWNEVPVDTLVRVRDYEDDEWLLRYFKCFSRTPSECQSGRDYEVWALGATSVTAEGDTEQWKYCELVEDEKAALHE